MLSFFDENIFKGLIRGLGCNLFTRGCTQLVYIKIIFEHLTEDFEVFDFRDKVNVATYSIFSASKYIHDMLNTCVKIFVPI